MPSLFARLDTVAQAAQERVFGESFTLRPRKRSPDVNGGWIADTARAEVTLTAIYVERDASPLVPDAFDPRQDRRPGVSAHTHVVEIDPRRWPADPNPNDVLVRLANGERWLITSIDPQTDGRLLCNVAKAI